MLQERNVTTTAVHGKDCLPLAGEYTGEVVLKGLVQFLGGGLAGGRSRRPWKAAVDEMGPDQRPRRRTC